VSVEVRDNAASHRYELETDGGVAVAEYEVTGGSIVFTHTVVPPAARGRGVGQRLIAGALADVRRRGLSVLPDCPFVAAYIAAHPAEQDLLAT
jgi:uncharacterized protein